MNFFSGDDFAALLDLLEGAGDEEIINQFTGFFREENGNYYLNSSMDDYTAFLDELFDGQDYSPFITWTEFAPGPSTQGGGVLPG